MNKHITLLTILTWNKNNWKIEFNPLKVLYKNILIKLNWDTLNWLKCVRKLIWWFFIIHGVEHFSINVYIETITLKK